MQDTTKKTQDYKARRANGIQIVDASTGALNAPTPEALREAHMTLVRAEQGLYALVQASQATTVPPFGASAGFGYPTQQAFPAGFAGPAYASAYSPYASAPYASAPYAPAAYPHGFVPSATFPTPASMAYGIPQYNAWTPWTGGVSVASSPLRAGSGIAPAAFVSGVGSFGGLVGNRALACDIIDEGKQFVCQLELPGVQADQIELLCFERAVSINAHRETGSDIANLVQSERGTAVQQRVIALPNPIQTDAAKATLSDGILTVILPKVHPTEGPRRVDVQG
jgi:HSP20 family molecular chaperone IbpA